MRESDLSLGFKTMFLKAAECPLLGLVLIALILLLKNSVILPLLFKYGTKVPCERGLT